MDGTLGNFPRMFPYQFSAHQTVWPFQIPMVAGGGVTYSLVRVNFTRILLQYRQQYCFKTESGLLYSVELVEVLRHEVGSNIASNLDIDIFPGGRVYYMFKFEGCILQGL